MPPTSAAIGSTAPPSPSGTRSTREGEACLGLVHGAGVERSDRPDAVPGGAGVAVPALHATLGTEWCMVEGLARDDATRMYERCPFCYSPRFVEAARA